MNRSAARVAIPLLAATATVALSAYLRARSAARSHPPDSAPGRSARRARFGRYVVAGRSVTIAAPPMAIYEQFRDIRRLASFMANVRAVEPARDGAWRWTLAGPGGSTVAAVTRLVTDRPGAELAWRSVEGSQIDTEGKIRLRPAPGGRGTQVTAVVAYRPPAGIVGHWVAKAFRRDPEAQGRHDLKRLKMLMETGEIATAAMRPGNGERGGA